MMRKVFPVRALGGLIAAALTLAPSQGVAEEAAPRVRAPQPIAAESEAEPGADAAGTSPAPAPSRTRAWLDLQRSRTSEGPLRRMPSEAAILVYRQYIEGFGLVGPLDGARRDDR